MKHNGDNMASVKRSNRSGILYLLHQHGALSRKRIAEMMSLTPAAITIIISEMIQENLVAEGSVEKTSGFAGRKETPIMLSVANHIALGVSINLDELLLSASDLRGNLISSKTVPHTNRIAPDTMVQLVTETLQAMLSDNNITSDKVIGIGVTVRGIVDMGTGCSVDSFGALSAQNVPLLDMIHQRISCPVSIDNNVRGMLRSHVFFAEQFESGVFFVRCEKGIGSAVLADNRILNGSSGMCSEFGHVPVILKAGKTCKCGRIGCLETIASPTAILEEATALFSKDSTPTLWDLAGGDLAEVSLSLVLEAAIKDQHLQEVINCAAKHLANGIKSAICLLDPAQVVLYGSIFESELYMRFLIGHVKDGFESRLESTEVLKSPFNLRLESVSACVLAIDTFYQSGGQKATCLIG